MKKNYQIPISQRRADELYDIAGTEEIEVKGELVILPAPSVLTSEDEGLIMEAKRELGILHDLDDFQIQSVLSLINDTNVVLVSPCGSGKMLVFYLALHCLRKKKCNPRGIGVCLEPLNNILCEKTNNDPPMKTAYVTMTGDAVKSDSVKLSHSLDEVRSGEIGCLFGHAESFLFSKRYTKYFLHFNKKYNP